MDLGLQGKHAIVTGGSSLGIGKAIARELARKPGELIVATGGAGRSVYYESRRR